jgi:hypothetical protein
MNWTGYTVGEDGKTLTETEAFFRKDGTPAVRIAYFSRAQLAVDAQPVVLDTARRSNILLPSEAADLIDVKTAKTPASQ